MERRISKGGEAKCPKPVCAPIVDRAAYATSNIRILRQELAEIQQHNLTAADLYNVEEILEEISKQKEIVRKWRADPVEEWCVSNPSDAECLVYDL